MSWHRGVIEKTPEKTEYFCWNGQGEWALETEWHNVPALHEIAKGINAMHDRPNFKDANREDRLGTHVAYIPEYVTEFYWRTHGVNLLADKERVRWWVNQPENSGWRTMPGKI